MNGKDNIAAMQLYKAAAPLKKAIADSTHTLTEISFIVLRVQTRSGIKGESYLLSFQYSPRAIAGAIKDLESLARSFSIWETDKFNQAAAASNEYFGNCGLLNWARTTDFVRFLSDQSPLTWSVGKVIHEGSVVIREECL
jgi:hypothetical protein